MGSLDTQVCSQRHSVGYVALDDIHDMFHTRYSGFFALSILLWFAGCSQNDAEVTTDTATQTNPTTEDATTATADGSQQTCTVASDCEATESCRTSSCEEGVCVYTVGEGSCYINDECYASEDPNPTNACQECNPSTAVDAWTYLDGKSGWSNEQIETVEGADDLYSCVDPCIAYCEAVSDACPAAKAELQQYLSEDDLTLTETVVGGFSDCSTYCRNWEDIEPSGNTSSSNSIACRLENAVEAAKSDENALLLCPIAGPTGGNQCGTWCDNYCQLGMKNCPDSFSNLEQCLNSCSEFSTDGKSGDTSGNTVQCRIHYLGIAPADLGGSANCQFGLTDSSQCSDTGSIEGNTCEDPLDVAMIPFFSSGNTKTSNSTYSECTADGESGMDASGAGEADHIWLLDGAVIWPTLSSSSSATVTVTVTPDFDATIYVLNGTCGSDLTCGTPKQAASSQSTSDDATTAASTPLTLTFTMNTSESRWIVIDGLSTPTDDASTPTTQTSGDYTIRIEAGPTCTDYCAKVMTACTDRLAQYTSQEECVSWCGTRTSMAAGSTDDTYGNTIGCRMWHAVAAENAQSALNYCSGTNQEISTAVSNIESLCASAGPLGGSACGDYCDVYCDLQMSTCIGVSEVYSDRDTCSQECEKMDAGAPGATKGNNRLCRIAKLGSATLPDDSATEIVPECADTGITPADGTDCAEDCVDGCASKACGTGSCGETCGTCGNGEVCDETGVCVGDCDRYCERMMCNCSDAYASKAECIATCSGSEESAGYDGVLLDCLAYHAGMAATNSAHCGYASGTEAVQQCADWCTHYCSLESGTSCGLYGDDSTTSCSDDCATFSAAEPSANFHITHIDKNSTQCRIYYLIASGATSGTTGTECADAAVSSTTCAD